MCRMILKTMRLVGNTKVKIIKTIKMRVRIYMDNVWEVVDYYDKQLFKGSIADCEAFVRLKKEGHIE